ncbi:hypothetical protein ACVI8L_006054 [Bradyrhizobium diazoefficiens]
MTRLSRDDVVKAVDRADEVTIAQIIGTGATVEELAEAQAWLANDEPLINDLRPLAQGRVRELVDILSELEEEDDEAGPAEPGSASARRLGSAQNNSPRRSEPLRGDLSFQAAMTLSSASASTPAPRTGRSPRFAGPCR